MSAPSMTEAMDSALTPSEIAIAVRNGKRMARRHRITTSVLTL
jgi:hypothetical protein